jgi:hypothetical protein
MVLEKIEMKVRMGPLFKISPRPLNALRQLWAQSYKSFRRLFKCLAQSNYQI